jgi:hypothetical protein
MSKNDEIDRTCPPPGVCLAADRVRYDADVADAKSTRTLSIVGYAVGGAGLLGGAVLLMLPTRNQKDASLTMRASVGTDAIGASVTSTW